MTRDQLLEYLEHFTLVTDGNRLAELIGRFTLGMGYDYYRFALILPMSMQRPKVVLFNQCPDSWVQAYTVNNMLACDPIIQLARTQTLPIYWNRLDEKARFLQEGSMDVMGLAAEFGLRELDEIRHWLAGHADAVEADNEGHLVEETLRGKVFVRRL